MENEKRIEIIYLVVHEPGNGRLDIQGCFTNIEKAKTYIKMEIVNEARGLTISPWEEKIKERRWECVGEAYEIREFDLDWTPLTGHI